MREPMEWELVHVPAAQLARSVTGAGGSALCRATGKWTVICEVVVPGATAAILLAAVAFERAANVADGTSGDRRIDRPLAVTAAQERDEA